ncbi:TetR/AcrR family transcriptional regulator [Methanobacterium oryzae]|uniref:TetR/AcrR family transcriptional regulator n=1 Tax=Methanobacterium oryzae TaxID=69540 RepID=UPI003D2361E4
MSTVGRRELEKERRRNNILNAAEKLFFSKGYDNVSLNEIAKEADLGRSTVYLYFENKEELFFAIVLKGTQILHRIIINETKKAKTSLEKLAAFRKAYYEFADKYPDYLKVYNYLLSGRFDLVNIEDTKHKIEFFADSKLYSEIEKNLEEIYLKTLDQGNIPNFPIPKFTVSEYLNEIIRLRQEMLSVICNALELGKKEGTIRPDINSVEATVLFTLIANSIDNLPPDLRSLLESQKINHDKFLADVGEFIGYMVSNRGYNKK